MTIETPPTFGAVLPCRELPSCSPDDTFTAVVGSWLESWRVIAVLGTRVLAECDTSGERRSFTLRFVRYRLLLAAQELVLSGMPRNARRTE
ncbi:hypothetical protein [Rathayibacter toxicus]|uniref:Uncharacterized protein n=1 Tax=Rathayibacter toxicus TaxID=145458 RepID=A0A0C5BBB2_9MICO|nr:hypothetical protein [Rathayibacter toxicus]AJM78193.1 hypothetical protein TI83_10180 [Rathayibacter toxicus]ALS57526.1 hypothetical protein APU90_06880 [Rathayibacter toxicus]KKM46771.1 hypothetical protein VT73_01815 [Rathayibacter toxicus]PPG20805.1 hypothetical protein C5D15_10045 [Rathayibacter toxicus]PPG45909.1 hypothetical protein C5D16_10015 [Rathayibacter toxicus]